MAGNPLVGRRFQITAIVDHGQEVPIVEGTVPTLTFRETSFHAETGCNRVSGTYDFDLTGRFIAREIFQTMMKCGPLTTGQQHRIKAVLAGQPTIELAGPSLTLSTETSVLHAAEVQSDSANGCL